MWLRGPVSCPRKMASGCNPDVATKKTAKEGGVTFDRIMRSAWFLLVCIAVWAIYEVWRVDTVYYGTF
jgi:hypothetical protein